MEPNSLGREAWKVTEGPEQVRSHREGLTLADMVVASYSARILPFQPKDASAIENSVPRGVGIQEPQNQAGEMLEGLEHLLSGHGWE